MLQTAIVPTEVEPGVYPLSGGSHNSLVIEQQNNETVLFIVDIYSPGQTPAPTSAQELFDAITVDHKIDVAKIAGGHGGTGTFAEFKVFVPAP